MPRFYFYGVLIVVCAVFGFAVYVSTLWLWAWLIVGPLIVMALYDHFQNSHAILRNFPILGHGRYFMEMIRPEINQYFIESDTNGRPFSRELRSLVYQRSKSQIDTIPFGTKQELYEQGFEWVNHSLNPKHVDPDQLRISIGGVDCAQPYHSSILNISAMSFGSLSCAAIEALSGGARRGGFAHNTGEGGISPYHLRAEGDLIWQIGTGYFGCRTEDGGFSAKLFAENAERPSVKMIEIKLSQGAKPGHGGILPGRKVTEELAQIRGVKVGETVVSPPAHRRFSTPIGLLEFVQELRVLSGGKPVGFKLCVGIHREFLAIGKAMLQLGYTPDFITVDGAEGGTGAAPLEFSNRIGSPGIEGLIFVHNALVGLGLRDKIRIIYSGRVITGFDIVRCLALGADACNSARGMMFALGCIQALRCNENNCPTGVATQDPSLVRGLHVPSKTERVANYHKHTLQAVAEMIGAMGLQSTEELRPSHITRRVNENEVTSLDHQYDWLDPESLLRDSVPKKISNDWAMASPDRF